MAMTKNQIATLEDALAALTTGGSDEIRAILDSDRVRIYLNTWVVPKIQKVIEHGRGERGGRSYGTAWQKGRRR